MYFENLSKMLRHLARVFFGKHPQALPVNLVGKNIIVTGVSPGSVGFATAKALAQWGATVIITTRRKPEEAVRALKSSLSGVEDCGKIVGRCLDLTQADSVTEFSDWYREEFSGCLDVLINNAGVHLDLLSKWKEPMLTDDGLEIHWRTNYLGSAMLTHYLLPCLIKAGKKNGEARVVNVASHLHTRALNNELFTPDRPYDSWNAYGQSKLALLHHAFELHRRYMDKYNIKAYALHPGSIATNISGKGLEGTGIIQTLRNIFSPVEAMILLSPDEGAQTQLLCATGTKVKSGQYYQRCEQVLPSEETKDQRVASKLWENTERWINETNKQRTSLP